MFSIFICCSYEVASVVSDSVPPHGQQPTRLPCPRILQAKILEWVAISCSDLIIKSCQLFGTPWTIAHQAPLSMGFPRQEYWNGLPFLSPRDLPELLAYKLAKCFISNVLDLSTPFCGTQGRFQIFWEDVPSHCYQASRPYSRSPWSTLLNEFGHGSPSFPLSIQSEEHSSGFCLSIIFPSAFFHSDWPLSPRGKHPIFSASLF